MLTREQINIFKVFYTAPFNSFTFKQIKTLSKQKSNNAVQIALKNFKKLDLIITKDIADVHSYSLNFDNVLTLKYLELINTLNLRTSPEILRKIHTKILKHTAFYILILFGSHAKGTSTKDSDIDVAVIVESEQTKKDILPLLETIKRRELIKIDYHVFERKEYLEMLKSEEENLGKQVDKYKQIYYGYEQYYLMIKRFKHE